MEGTYFTTSIIAYVCTVHAEFIRDVHLDDDTAVFEVFRKLLAFFSAASLPSYSLISAKIILTAPASANAYAVSSPMLSAACNHSNHQ